MERPPRLNSKLAIFIIILFHAVGLVGLMLPETHTLFLKIVPFHLLLMLLVVFFSHKSIDSKYTGFVLIIYLSGFVAEWIGVHTGWLFGNYAYGDTLGTKLFDIPLTIGVNWFLLIYATGVTTKRMHVKKKWARVLLGALIMVLLDEQIEPIAIRFDYWHWHNDAIPVTNYICWFLVSSAMLWLFERLEFKKQSWVGPVLLGVQFLFFGVLNLL
ncbi:carotenoid biosynthesis protein [Mucilaginibacter agri]|uniref:Carotenoid biosynthesis protein n=1 Tax=Mucilaginibacter agri TaxID=2695265 RepID=A0A966DQN6_9SPHI|nr:carotenoid biosynthesis protein [Mucilaginibacter agri]NCD68183.1 carotenoid biosynthesis protein [Mucilaginibacter agri]